MEEEEGEIGMGIIWRILYSERGQMEGQDDEELRSEPALFLA